MRIVSSGILMICGACIALGIIHFRFWLMERARRDQLAFSLVCFSVSGFALFELLMLYAPTPEHYLFYARLSHLANTPLFISMLWFAYVNLQGRRWLFLTCAGLRLLVFTINFIIPNGINFREVKSVGHVTLFGESVGYPIAVPNPWMLLAQLSHLMLLIFCLDASVRAWRRGERRKALVFGSGVVLYGGTILFFSVGILWGLIALPVVISFSVLFVVAGMVYELNYDMQSAAILSKKLVERETTLSETLKHLNLSAAAANVGMWTRKAGEEVVWLSEKGLEIWELTGERQYTLEDLMERIYPDDRQIIIAAGEDFENGNSEFVSEFRIVRRNGKLRWVETRGKVELINGVRTVRGAVVNINKRKLAEEAARRNEEQNTAIVTAIPDMIFLQDSDGVYLGFHAHEKENLLSSPEEFIGKNMRDVLPPALAGEFLVSFERAANGHGPQIVEYKLNHNHEDKWYEARIVWTGNIFLSVVRDITRLKLASEAVYDLSHRLLDAQEKERARLARELHDDLGQSLALLSIQLSQLNEDVGDASAARHVIEHLVSEISLLAAHVHRISHELHPAILQQLGLVPALRGICRELTAAHHNLKIDFESENITSKIPNDVSLCLYRVAQETLQNVVKHSCATSAQVNLKMESGKLLLSISDNGVGFDMNDRKIKQSLGLISIQERVHAVKGAVKIVSEPGNGTKIEASAPINRRG